MITKLRLHVKSLTGSAYWGSQPAASHRQPVLPVPGWRTGGALGRHSWPAVRPRTSAPSTGVTENTETDGGYPVKTPQPPPRDRPGEALFRGVLKPAVPCWGKWL